MSKLTAPFLGEMQCTKCGALARGPGYCGGWRAIDGDKRHRYYACPKCRPADDAPQQEWTDFYVHAVRVLWRRAGERQFKEVLIWRETTNGPLSSVLN